MRKNFASLALITCLALVPASFAQSAAVKADCGCTGPSSNSEVSLAISPGLANEGTPVTMTADVQPTEGGPNATGTVGFWYGSYLLGTAPVGNTIATLIVDTRHIPNGSYSIIARYSGNSIYHPASSYPQDMNVSATPNSEVSLVISSTTVTPGDPFTMTADVQPTQGGASPTGQVLFFSGTNGQYFLGTATIKNTVAVLTIPTANIPRGGYEVYAVYTGDSYYHASISNNPSIFVQ